MQHQDLTSTKARIVGGDAVAWVYRLLIESPPGTSSGLEDQPVLCHKAVPNGARPQLLIPTGSRRAAVATVTANRGLRRPRSRLARHAAAVLLRVAGQRALRHEVSASVSASLLADVDLAEVSLLEHVRQTLDEPELLAAIRLVPNHRMPKPGLQLFRPDGTAVGYAKVGWNAVTRRLVEREAAVLADLDLSETRWLAAPTLMHRGDWHGRYILVTTPLPANVRRMRRGDPDPLDVAREVPRLDPGGRAAVGEAPYWQTMLADFDELRSKATAGPAMLDAASRLIEDIAERYADVELEWGRWHGDWTTWNLGTAGGRVWAWDWEFSTRGVPLGFDVLQHVVQHALIGEDLPLVRALSAASAVAADWLSAEGIGGAAVDATVALHRLELLRREAHWAAEVRPDRRFAPDILAAPSLPRQG